MEFIIAVLILVVLSVFFMGLRAYMSFCALIVGLPMVLMGIFGEKELLIVGLIAVAYALLAAYFTVRTSPKSMLRLQIFRFFGYGMFLFLQVMMIMLIVLIPLAKIFGQFARSYRDVMLVDRLGREVGTITLDDRNQDSDGNTHTPRDPDNPY